MTVYVDNMSDTKMGKLGRMKMSHMIADTHEELMDIAAKIGLQSRWIQKAGTPQEHFDVSLSAKRKAVENGAVQITMRELAIKIRYKRKSDTVTNKTKIDAE